MSKLADLNISELEIFLLEGIAGHIASGLEGNTVVRHVGIGVRV